MNVNPGELKKRIQIIQKKETQNQNGFPKNEEVIVKKCRASFKRTSGTEVAKANADFSDIKARFMIRYTSTKITRKMIVRYNGTDYNIVYLNDYNDSHEYIEIWCDLVVMS